MTQNFERFWWQSLYWHDSDWPTKSIWFDKPRNSAWQTSSDRLFKEYNQLVWIILAEHHFTVEVANQVSKFSKISCSVPQGLILGSLLFLISRNSWYSFYQPRKDERLSRPWSHPMVSKMSTRNFWELRGKK